MTGFVDLQVNGYAGVDFNSDSLSDDQFAAVSRRLAEDGVAMILATIITAPIETMLSRIARIALAIDSIPEVAQVIGGIHVEGPFISAADGYVGAHPKSVVMEADDSMAQQLLDAGRGHVKLLTLAPERDPRGAVTKRLVDRGILVAGGHSDASLSQIQCAIDQGMSLFTHLGNGCPGQLPRHDNVIQRVLSVSGQLFVSFIADGHHVPMFALRNYLNCTPDDRVVIVTDAISAAGLGPGQYPLGDQMVHVDDHGAAWAEDRTHFAGCATKMSVMADLLRQQLGASDEQVQRWTRLNPMRLLSHAKG